MFSGYHNFVLYLKDCSVDCMAKNKEVCTNLSPVLLLYRHIE